MVTTLCIILGYVVLGAVCIRLAYKLEHHDICPDGTIMVVVNGDEVGTNLHTDLSPKDLIKKGHGYFLVKASDEINEIIATMKSA